METPKQEIISFSLPLFTGPEGSDPLVLLDPELDYILVAEKSITELMPNAIPEAHRVYGDFEFNTPEWTNFQYMLDRLQVIKELWAQGLATKAKESTEKKINTSVKRFNPVKCSKHRKSNNRKGNKGNKAKKGRKSKRNNKNKSKTFNNIDYDSDDGSVTPRPTPIHTPTPSLAPLYFIFYVPWSKHTITSKAPKEGRLTGKAIDDRLLDINRAQELGELFDEFLPKEQIQVEVKLGRNPDEKQDTCRTRNSCSGSSRSNKGRGSK